MLPKETIKKVRLKAGINSKRDYAMFVILDEGGLRVSELIKLELERDIDFDMYQIRILGKGQKIRSIFMDKILNGRVNKYLFVSNKSANTNKPIGRTSINNILNKYCNEIQHKKIKPHIFRHDCATKKYEDGYTDIMIKKQLGQTSNVTDISHKIFKYIMSFRTIWGGTWNIKCSGIRLWKIQKINIKLKNNIYIIVKKW